MKTFDAEELLDTFMQDKENAKILLAHFIERTAAQLETLPGLMEQKNREEAFRIVHTIKGTAKTLSGMELGNIAAIAGEAYKQKNMQEMEEALPRLAEAFVRFKSAAEDFLQS